MQSSQLTTTKSNFYRYDKEKNLFFGDDTFRRRNECSRPR